MIKNNHFRTYVLIALILVVGILSFLVIQPFFIPLALAGIFCVVLLPLYKKVLKLFRGRRGLAALITELIALLCVIIPLSFIGTNLIGQAENLASTFTSGQGTSIVESLAIHVGSIAEPYIPGAALYLSTAASKVGLLYQGIFSWVLLHTTDAFAQTFAFLFDLFVFLITIFYFLKDGHSFGPRILKLSPLSEEDTLSITHRIVLTTNSIVRGSLSVALIQGVIATIGFSIFGVPNPLVWGLCTSIAALVPGIGTSLILVPVVIYLFATGNTSMGLGMAVWSILAVGLVDNIIGPRLMGGKAELHPLLILVSVVGGLSFFGPAGLFLGPLVVSLLSGLLELYSPQVKELT